MKVSPEDLPQAVLKTVFCLRYSSGYSGNLAARSTTWRPISQLAAAKTLNMRTTTSRTAAIRPIQRSRRVTKRERRNVISVASAIGTNTERPKYSAATTNAKSNSAQIPLNAAAEDSGAVRGRMGRTFLCLLIRTPVGTHVSAKRPFSHSAHRISPIPSPDFTLVTATSNLISEVNMGRGKTFWSGFYDESPKLTEKTWLTNIQRSPCSTYPKANSCGDSWRCNRQPCRASWGSGRWSGRRARRKDCGAQTANS